MIMKKIIFTFIAFAALALSLNASAATCINLTANLSQGSTGPDVTSLQAYLFSEGYLLAMPNGYFGPATFAAVKKLQAANGISATGTVGPATRALIKSKSCAVVPVTPAQPTQLTTPTQTPSSLVSSKAPIIVSLPSGGENLSYGDTYTVKWSGPTNVVYNVVLDDVNGTPQGFLIPGTYANQYTWQVGVVRSGSDDIVVPPGNYRIHVMSASDGAQTTDRVSGVFTISASIHADQVIPRTVVADGKSAAVVFGSGFNSTSQVNLDFYGLIGANYVSDDGKVLVFTIPNTAAPGQRNFTISNTYGSASTMVNSNSLVVNVVRQ